MSVLLWRRDCCTNRFLRRHKRTCICIVAVNQADPLAESIRQPPVAMLRYHHWTTVGGPNSAKLVIQ